VGQQTVQTLNVIHNQAREYVCSRRGDYEQRKRGDVRGPSPGCLSLAASTIFNFTARSMPFLADRIFCKSIARALRVGLVSHAA
jgi:hypothetical protein